MGLGGLARCSVVFGAQQLELARQILACHGTEARHGRQQGAGVAVLGPGKDFFGTAFFNLVAAVHHQHAVGHFSHHTHVVGDEYHAHVHFFLQRANQLQNLRLNGHVERGRRLIGNQ